MGKIQSFKDLSTWKKAVDLATEVYKVVGIFPSDERFGLVSQMKRASISISTNIAEGFGRKTAADKIRFYTMALGSCDELDSLLFVAMRLAYISEEAVLPIALMTDEQRVMIHGMMRSASTYVGAETL